MKLEKNSKKYSDNQKECRKRTKPEEEERKQVIKW